MGCIITYLFILQNRALTHRENFLYTTLSLAAEIGGKWTYLVRDQSIQPVNSCSGNTLLKFNYHSPPSSELEKECAPPFCKLQIQLFILIPALKMSPPSYNAKVGNTSSIAWSSNEINKNSHSHISPIQALIWTYLVNEIHKKSHQPYFTNLSVILDHFQLGDHSQNN